MKKSRVWWPSLEEFGRYSDYQDCLRIVWQNVGASGLRIDDLLLPYQKDLFGDLADGIDEHALSELYNWWEYDIPALFERGRQFHPHKPAKPRIRLWMEVSSKGNFKCEWWPVGVDNYGNTDSQGPPDWTYWYRSENRYGGWDSRPSNELLFIHGVYHALSTVNGHREDPRPILDLDHVLMQGIARLAGDLKARLEPHFDVVMLKDLFLQWEPEEWSWHGEDRIMKWEIDDPVRRQNQAELAELNSIKERLGFSEKQFEEQWVACAQQKGSGPPPALSNVSRKVAKAFREAGLKRITSGDTDRVCFLIEKHRGKSLTRAPAEVISFPGGHNRI